MNNNSNSENSSKRGVISLLLGALSIIIGMAGVWFVGIISTGTALVLAMIGLIISIRCRKATSGRRGTAGFCSSLIGVAIAGSLTLVCIIISLASGRSTLLGLSGTDVDFATLTEDMDEYDVDPEEFVLTSEMIIDHQNYINLYKSVQVALDDENVKKEIGNGYELVLPAKKGATWEIPDKPYLIELINKAQMGDSWQKYKVKRSECFWDQDGNSVKEWKIIVHPDGSTEMIAPYK